MSAACAAIVCCFAARTAKALPSISGTAEAVTVTVPAGEVSSPCGVILCWGDSFAGEAVADWPHSHVLTTNGVTSAGGSFSASAAELGLTPGQCLRAFIVPGEVKRVEYVMKRSTFYNVYIDTGVRAQSGTRAVAEMMWLNLVDEQCFCGARVRGGDKTRMFLIHVYNQKWFHGYGENGWPLSAFAVDTRYQVDSRLYNGLQRLTVTDVATGVATTMNDQSKTGDVDVGANLYVFAADYPEDANGPVNMRAAARCYWLKLYENGDPETNIDGDLVRDFVPVKDYYGHGALYDRKGDKVYALQHYNPGNSQSRYYLTCGEETGESLVILQPETVVSGCGGYYLEDGMVSAKSSQISVTVAPDMVFGETNALVVCWGDRDYGPRAADWPHRLDETPLVGQEGGTFAFSPEGVKSGAFVRAFLVQPIGLADYISSEDNADYNSISVYLDTGVKMKHGLRVETCIAWLAKWKDCGFMGARPTSGDTRFLPIYDYENGQWGLGYGNGNWNKGAFETDTPYTVESKLYVGEQRLTVNGIDKYTGTSNWAPDYDKTVFAFAVNFHSSALNPDWGCKAKCYYLKMYTDGDTATNPDGTLARDYVPAVSDGVAGMFDRVNNTFTASAGSKDFKYGSVTNTMGNTAVTYCASNVRQAPGGGFFLIVR